MTSHLNSSPDILLLSRRGRKLHFARRFDAAMPACVRLVVQIGTFVSCTRILALCGGFGSRKIFYVGKEGSVESARMR
jgi:hypothetical protein